MRKLFYLFIVMMLTIWVAASCRQTPPASTDEERQDSDTTVVFETIVDSTVYGICGEGTTMHTLELVTDGGDTLYYTMRVDEDADIVGGMMVGDRMAIMGKTDSVGFVAKRVINLTTLLGKWTSIDKNFEIVEGGLVNSNVEAESNPWVSWKILNGKLLMNTDTFDIVELGADSLYLENKNGIFVYKRQH